MPILENTKQDIWDRINNRLTTLRIGSLTIPKISSEEKSSYQEGVDPALYQQLVSRGNKPKDIKEYFAPEKTSFAKEFGKTALETKRNPKEYAQEISNVKIPESRELKPWESEYNLTTKKTKYKQEIIIPGETELDTKWVDAVYGAESTRGTDRKNEFKDAGKFGWLVGFTKVTYNDIVNKAKAGDKRYVDLLKRIDLDTEEGAKRSAVEYANFNNTRFNDSGEPIGKYYTDPVDIYANAYNASGVKDREAARRNFLKYYNQPTSLTSSSNYFSDGNEQENFYLNDLLRLPRDSTSEEIKQNVKKWMEQEAIDRQEVIKKAPPIFSIGGLLNLLRDKLPFFQNVAVENRLKQEVQNKYNWTDEAKKDIKDLPIKDYSPIIEPVLGIVRGNRGLKSYGGQYSEKITNIKLPFNFELTKKSSFVSSVDLIPEVSGHELLHYLFNKWEFGDYYDEFNQDWDNYIKNGRDKGLVDYMKQSDNTLNNNSLYKDINNKNVADERFAYLGMTLTKDAGSINRLPKELQRWYSDIFK